MIRVAAVGVAPLALRLQAPPQALAQTASRSAIGYQVLSPGEAELTEAIVNSLCPADAATPNGVACGLAGAIDQALAGPWGSSPADASGMSQRQFYSIGLAAVNLASITTFGRDLTQVDLAMTSKLIGEILSGRLDSEAPPLQAWVRGQLHPILKRASFADPIYSSYSNRVYWKIFA